MFYQGVKPGKARIIREFEFPPMQKGASFNLDAVKEKIEEAIKAHHGQ